MGSCISISAHMHIHTCTHIYNCKEFQKFKYSLCMDHASHTVLLIHFLCCSLWLTHTNYHTHTHTVTQQHTPYGLLSVSAACWIPTVRSWLCRMPGMCFCPTVPSDLYSVPYQYRYSTSEWLNYVSLVCSILSFILFFLFFF